MKVIQEIKNDIMLLKNIGNIPKEVELVLLRKLTSLEKQLTLTDVGCTFYYYDKTVANAEEDYDFQQCDKQCEKCMQ